MIMYNMDIWLICDWYCLLVCKLWYQYHFRCTYLRLICCGKYCFRTLNVSLKDSFHNIYFKKHEVNCMLMKPEIDHKQSYAVLQTWPTRYSEERPVKLFPSVCVLHRRIYHQMCGWFNATIIGHWNISYITNTSPNWCIEKMPQCDLYCTIN